MAEFVPELESSPGPTIISASGNPTMYDVTNMDTAPRAIQEQFEGAYASLYSCSFEEAGISAGDDQVVCHLIYISFDSPPQSISFSTTYDICSVWRYVDGEYLEAPFTYGSSRSILNIPSLVDGPVAFIGYGTAPDAPPSGTTITYNGSTIATLSEGQTATMACAGKKAVSDIVVVFAAAGTVGYNGKETAVEAGETATLSCAGKKMVGNVVIAVRSRQEDELLGTWALNSTLKQSTSDVYSVTNLENSSALVDGNVVELSSIEIAVSEQHYVFCIGTGDSISGYVYATSVQAAEIGISLGEGWYSVDDYAAGDAAENIRKYNVSEIRIGKILSSDDLVITLEWLKANATKQNSGFVPAPESPPIPEVEVDP